MKEPGMSHEYRRLRTVYLLILAAWVAACGRTDSITTPVTPTQVTNAGVAELLRNPPPIDQIVEITAYVVPIGQGMPSGGWPGGGGMCQLRILTDIPFAGSVRTLDRISSGPPPQTIPWLNALGGDDLPHHARFRGHVADPAAYGNCPSSTPIFVVDAILEVYQQNPPVSMQMPDEVDGIDSWRQYDDAALGYHLIYPPTWQIEEVNNDQGLPVVTIRSPEFPEHPIMLRVYSGEISLDPHDAAHSPAIVRNGTLMQQSQFSVARKVASQGLWATVVRRVDDQQRPTIGAVFAGGGHTYDFSLVYSEDRFVPQLVLDTLAVMVAGFRLDTPPAPTPDTVAQTIDPSRTYLDQPAATERARALLRASFGFSSYEITDVRMLSERDLREEAQECSLFQGHAGAVWSFTIRGMMSGHVQVAKIGLNAESGELLCSQLIESQIELVQGTPTIDPLTATAIEQSHALTPGITPEVIPGTPVD